ncbi:hypothetical protein ASPZODRAFT_16025 [Penicilliopsis zonata CBS 506.65]|uniref:3-phytase n=1 Tax=Penicilliopsis zonata CBS 506.65 TaxID=1073090 RepID=A0A1L9SJK7_9EURO|nr:hypothetical protein ASPZODRAFT_16025 [Penicilliopsis zonata CBS 506.65]OJJ47345.1 hypothetical protein ASPZODRAFT_16025 [Penicilliopsis zonata CBS 506.65]
MKASPLALLAASVVRAQVEAPLAPADDVVFPSASNSDNPLIYSGGNTPYWAGPNTFGIDSDVPDQCTVQQAAYVVRHGSRFPDSGSYGDWVEIYDKIQIAVKGSGFAARDALSFIADWEPVLTDTALQMSQESRTGWKEATDLGYQLRSRYPTFYTDGEPFYIWANQYASPINESRVVQTARAFAWGYLYEFAEAYGTVVSVNSTGSVSAIGNSLGPSDSCPLYAATSSGGDNVTDFDATWLPATTARVNKLVSGNLTFSETDVTFFPYLCAYESQILGRLSPWCDVFTQDELKNYAYSQDLAYFYEVGPGSVGPAKTLFLPFLNSLMELFTKGPGQVGTGPNGTQFNVPNLIMAFLNDDQIAEMTAAMGIFEAEGFLPDDHIPTDHLYQVAHFITMRGTVAFEILNCTESESKSGKEEENDAYLRLRFNDAVWPLPFCQSGPGKSCLLSEYTQYISEKNKAAGNFIDYCNVTEAGHPETVGGATFFTDLSLDYLTFLTPGGAIKA